MFLVAQDNTRVELLLREAQKHRTQLTQHHAENDRVSNEILGSGPFTLSFSTSWTGTRLQELRRRVGQRFVRVERFDVGDFLLRTAVMRLDEGDSQRSLSTIGDHFCDWCIHPSKPAIIVVVQTASVPVVGSNAMNAMAATGTASTVARDFLRCLLEGKARLVNRERGTEQNHRATAQEASLLEN